MTSGLDADGGGPPIRGCAGRGSAGLRPRIGVAEIIQILLPTVRQQQRMAEVVGVLLALDCRRRNSRRATLAMDIAHEADVSHNEADAASRPARRDAATLVLLPLVNRGDPRRWRRGSRNSSAVDRGGRTPAARVQRRGAASPGRRPRFGCSLGADRRRATRSRTHPGSSPSPAPAHGRGRMGPPRGPRARGRHPAPRTGRAGCGL